MVPPSARFPTRRAALAEEAARRALAGLGPELVLPQLGALTQCVRRRPGWLYAMFPSGITCPVPARPALVQAAVLEALRPVLACGGQAVLEVKPRSRAVLLCLRGGAPAGVLPLWQALARQSGGAVVFDSGAQFAAAAFLPLCPGCSPWPGWSAGFVQRRCRAPAQRWPAAVRGRLQSKMPGCRTAAPCSHRYRREHTAACTASPHKAARPAPPTPGRYSQAAPMPPV